MSSKLYITFVLLCLFSILNFTILRAVFTPVPVHGMTFWGLVLGDDDDGKNDNEEDKENDEDEEEDDDKDEDEDKEDDNSDDNKNEDDKDEKQKKEKSKTKETIVSEDGTKTVIVKEIEGDKVESEIKVYNADGQIIEEREVKLEDGNEVKIEIKTRANDGQNLSEIKFKQEDNGGLKLEIKDEEASKSKVRFDQNKNEVIVKTHDSPEEAESDADEYLIRLGDEENEFEIEHEYQKAKVHYPINVDDDTGRVYVIGENGEQKEITQMPDQVVNKIKDRNSSVVVREMEIKENDDGLRYQITADKIERLFGVIDVAVPLLMEYDPSTGELKYSATDFGTALLDILSF